MIGVFVKFFLDMLWRRDWIRP